MNTLVKSAARRLLGPIGLTAGVRHWYRNAVRILMYHRFPPANQFAAQCEHLKKHYRPISLSEAVEFLRGSNPPPGAVVVTVDDGYGDFRDAHPILKANSIPALVYVATDLPDKKSWLWTDCLTRYLAQTNEGDGTAVKNKLKKLPDEERRAYLDALPGFDSPPPAEFAPLSWGDIRTLAKDGVEFGAHTRSHPILSRLGQRSRMEDEIAGSKQRLELEIGAPIRHFCYPNGQRDDYNDEVIGVVRDSGFQTAVTSIIGVNTGGADPFVLQRIPVDSTLDIGRFAHYVAGFYRY